MKYLLYIPTGRPVEFYRYHEFMANDGENIWQNSIIDLDEAAKERNGFGYASSILTSADMLKFICTVHSLSPHFYRRNFNVETHNDISEDEFEIIEVEDTQILRE